MREKTLFISEFFFNFSLSTSKILISASATVFLFFSVALPCEAHTRTHDYRVIIGSFQNRSNALNWQATLENLNIETTIEKALINSKTFWRVALSLSYADRRSAESALNRIKHRLRSLGYRTCDFWIRTPDVQNRYYHTPHYLEFDSYYH